MRQAGAGPSRRASRIFRELVVGLAVVGAIVLSAAPANAHTELAGASPRPGASVVGPLDVLRLVFGEPVVAELTEVTLSTDDVVMDLPRPVVTGPAVEVPVGDLRAPGSYLVAYRTVSADGHVIAGSYTFVLEPTPATPTGRTGSLTDVAPSAGAPKDPSTSPPWLREHASSQDGPSSAGARVGQLLTGLGIGTVVGASLVRRHRSRRRRQPG